MNSYDFFEVGTGWVPLIPISFFLMGSRSVTTIDTNSYLKEDLLREDLDCIFLNERRVRQLFGSFLIDERWADLKKLNLAKNTKDILDACSIKYLAPGDAANTSLNDHSVDFHFSCAVFEHIPLDILGKILLEGNRLLRKDGLFLHVIDYTDHFSHTDKTISPINMLTYSEKKWSFISGNRYNYVNRLRHDDFLYLFKKCGHKIVLDEPFCSDALFMALESEPIKLSKRFREKSNKILSTTGAWIGSTYNESYVL